ncbi:TfuA-like protein [Actinokineospora terrae]|uniref:TfuA-like core domain-containing protein n=1 Tax=Actinokineospora terrae TaxID=155974 RepID=A0A1H9UPU5_9PSEU|nr:TfuA-like protein [Actinokineospora terrae]SES11358.1 hypothetical protein SAMN04487818_107392 [Actinokineospora terrae]
MKSVAFVGPTAFGLSGTVFPADVEVRGPVRRGDVAALLGTEPGVLIVVDGTFHSFPAVGHVELRTAIAEGWQVWGLSSMGAIRAAEMRHLGMRGFGAVYQRYADDPDFADDEVALLHAAEAPHRPLSEPMIHIRSFVGALRERGLVSPAAADKVIEHLKNRWYAERTHQALRAALQDLADLPPAALPPFDDHRLKSKDLVRFTTEQPWRLG